MPYAFDFLAGRIPCLRVGSTAAPLVVINGGQAFMRRSSRERFEREAQRLTRILPEGQGFLLLGYGGAPPEDLDLAAVVDDFAVAIESLPGPVRLAGISYGGLVAARLAARRPGLVSDLLLIASGHSFSAEGLRRVERQVALASERRYPELLREFGGVFRRPWLNGLLRLRLSLRRRGLAEEMNDPELIGAYLRAGLEANGREGTAWLGQVRARTLVIGGEQDQFFGEGRMEETARAVPDGRLHLLPGETHMAPVERAVVFRQVITEFLARLKSMQGRSRMGTPKGRKVQA